VFTRLIRNFTLPLFAASLLVVAACGGDDDDNSGNPDAAINNPDSGSGNPDGSTTNPDGSTSNPDGHVGPTTDAGGTAGEVYCGTAGSCDLSTEICCVTGNGGSATSECTAEGDCTGNAKIFCDGPEDCETDEYCCGQIGNAGTSCSATACSLITICHGPSDCPGDSDQCCATDYGGYCSSFGCF